ncbi:MAG: hypothetical protein AAGD25_17105 [Cyanobacteria bacterium P01_F01_bin.150]
MSVEFQNMTLGELKQYVLKHRDSQSAFEALMDRIDAQPQQHVYGDVDANEFRHLLELHCSNVTVRNAEQGLWHWKNSDTLSPHIRQEILNANVLFVPFKQEHSSEGVFAAETESLFTYLRDSNRDEINADICVEDDAYRVEALYADPITITVLGTIVVSSIVAPIVKELLLDYIRDSKRKNGTDSDLRLKLIIDNEKGLIQEIHWSGSSREFEKLLPEAIDRVLSQQKLMNDSTATKASDT